MLRKTRALGMKKALSSKNLRVYHVTMTTYPETIGGIQSFIRLLHESLLKESIESSVISLGIMSKSEMTLRVFRIPIFGTYPYLLMSSFFTALAFAARHKKATCIIHAHDMLFGGLTGVLIKSMLNKPLVITDHGLQSVVESYTYDQKRRSRLLSRLFGVFLFLMEKFVALHADRIMCVSEYTYEYFLKRGVNPLRVDVVESGVDTDRFKPCRSLFSDGDVVMLYAGRISAEKGIVDLINVFGLLERERPELKLLIVGEGAGREVIGEMVRRLKLEGKVAMLPAVDTGDMESLYNNSDIVVIPSSIETGTPIVLLEAMACGRIVVVSPFGSLPHVVENAGLVAPFRKPLKASSLIENLLANRKKAHTLAENARKRVIERFNWLQCFKRILRVYHDVLASAN